MSESNFSPAKIVAGEPRKIFFLFVSFLFLFSFVPSRSNDEVTFKADAREKHSGERNKELPMVSVFVSWE